MDSGNRHFLKRLWKNDFFLGEQMIIIGRVIGVGRDKGDVEKDEEGIQTVKLLGKRIAWCFQKLHA